MTAELTATRQRTRQAIIDAAVAVLVRKRDATLADIAAAAGTHRSTLHRIFADRRELVDAVVRDSLDAIVSATEAAAVDQGPPVEALRRLAAGYLAVGRRIRFLFEDPAVMAEHPVVEEVLSGPGPFVDLIERGQAGGGFDPALPPEWVERTLWALVYAASEAADDGTLAPHEALPTLLRTLERGVACSG